MGTGKKILALTLSLVIGGTGLLWSHCQVPCGIYDDHMRIEMMYENIDTVEKAINSVKELQGEEDKNYNQIVRWVTNKEEHATKIIETVNKYFLAQRIKIAEKKESPKMYSEKLELLHKIIVYSMKTKQSLDTDNVEQLRKTVEKFEELYFQEK
ncbi:MAG: superoxide dismutase [Ni] [Elusimicrobiota bacterium]